MPLERKTAPSWSGCLCEVFVPAGTDLGVKLLKTLKNKKKNKFIVSEKQYIGIIATINGFRSTLASCEAVQALAQAGYDSQWLLLMWMDMR